MSTTTQLTDLSVYGPEAVTLAHDVLRYQGNIEFLKSWEQELKAAHISNPWHAKMEPPEIVGANGADLRMVVRRDPAKMVRRFDYAKLRAERRDLYAAHVVEKPADSPLVLTFTGKGAASQRSELWDELRSAGRETMARTYSVRDRQPAAQMAPVAIAKTVYDIRAHKARIVGWEKIARRALAVAIAQHTPDIGGPIVSGDGYIRVRPSSPTRTIDLDAAQSDPVLRGYITKTKRAESVTLWFEKVEFDPEGDYEPFEGD